MKVHSASRSSISNDTLGGTKRGWMGERSRPITCAAGKASPKSRAQIPVPVPTSVKELECGPN